MKLRNSQRGMTFWSTSFILFIIGFTAFVLLKLFPVYMEDLTIQSALEGVEQESATNDRNTAGSIRTALMKRLNVNNIETVSSKDFQVAREGEYYIVDLDYEVTIPFIGNISLLITFDHSASFPATN